MCSMCATRPQFVANHTTFQYSFSKPSVHRRNYHLNALVHAGATRLRFLSPEKHDIICRVPRAQRFLGPPCADSNFDQSSQLLITLLLEYLVDIAARVQFNPHLCRFRSKPCAWACTSPSPLPPPPPPPLFNLSASSFPPPSLPPSTSSINPCHALPPPAPPSLPLSLHQLVPTPPPICAVVSQQQKVPLPRSAVIHFMGFPVLNICAL
jgi:hypothetical protein